KAPGYTAVTIIAAIVVALVLNVIIGSIAGAGLGVGRGATSITGLDSGSTGEKVQAWANKMQEASKQAEAAGKSGDADAQAKAVGQLVGAIGSGGRVESLAPDRIKPFLPDTLVGLKRTRLSVERNAAMGVQISKGTATYSDDAGRSVTLTITDTGSLRGLVGFAAGWAGVEQESETDSGFEKTYRSGGQLRHEKWDSHAHYGEYSVVLGERFAVSAAGDAPGIDELKTAVGSVNLAGLEALKNEGAQAN
ncbi:MAG TPA: hypothetical protein VGD47_02300, partial [Steroidobacteraceae bacterium]